jgi:hypothetical protein
MAAATSNKNLYTVELFIYTVSSSDYSMPDDWIIVIVEFVMMWKKDIAPSFNCKLRETQNLSQVLDIQVHPR